HLAVPHGKAVVVFRGDHDVSHASFFGDPCPLIGVEFSWVEYPGNLLAVLRDRDTDVVHQPLCIGTRAASFVLATKRRVHPEVQEQTKGGFAPTCQRGGLLGRGRIRHEWRRLGAQCAVWLGAWRWCLFCLGRSYCEQTDGGRGEHGCHCHPGLGGHAFQMPALLWFEIERRCSPSTHAQTVVYTIGRANWYGLHTQ